MFEGKDVHSWHLNEFNRTAISTRNIEEESAMGRRSEIDETKLRELHAQGKSAIQIGELLGVQGGTISKHRRRLGLPNIPKPSLPATAKTKPQAIEVANSSAVAAAGSKANSVSTCRVVMFELSGSDTAILAAIETVRAALAGR